MNKALTRPRIVSAAMLAGFVAACLLASPAAHAEQAKYVFLMIGDGMGNVQRIAAELFINADTAVGADAKPMKRLVMNDMPALGFASTHSTNRLVTDSAAAGTALATGRKTANGMVSLSPDRSQRYVTVAELAKAAGLKVGVVTSVTIDHATPAAFYAHQSKRGKYYEIAMELGESGFNYFGGGGPAGAADNYVRNRTEPFDAARANGYTIVTTREQLVAAKGDRVWAYDGSLDGYQALEYAMDRSDANWSLAELTRKGIELLDNPKGFFMMVESGKIDWASHQNDVAATVHEVLAFDEAVAEAVAFYRKHPSETLVVVTADHETGGMTLGFNEGGSLNPTRLAKQTMSYVRFNGLIEQWRRDKVAFDDVLPTIHTAFGFTKLASRDIDRLKAAFEASMDPDRRRPRQGMPEFVLYGTKDPLLITCLRLVGEQAGIGFASFSHTGVPVPTTAIGVGSERFNGYYDNTDIPKRIAKVMGLNWAKQAVPAAGRP